MFLQKYTCKGNPFAFGEVFWLADYLARSSELLCRNIFLAYYFQFLQCSISSPQAITSRSGRRVKQKRAVLGDRSTLTLPVFCLEGLKRCVDFHSTSSVFYYKSVLSHLSNNGFATIHCATLASLKKRTQWEQQSSSMEGTISSFDHNAVIDCFPYWELDPRPLKCWADSTPELYSPSFFFF